MPKIYCLSFSSVVSSLPNKHILNKVLFLPCQWHFMSLFLCSVLGGGGVKIV